MPYVKSLIWGEEGAFRKLNIGPDTRIEELKLRRKMLQAHQWLGIITLAGLAYQYDVGKKLYDGDDSDYWESHYDNHKAMGYFTYATYMTGASLSIFAPPARKYDDNFSSIKFHRAMAVLHFSAMVAQPFLAKKAVELGLEVKPWVKTSLAPGSQVVTDYLAKAGLNTYLDQLGFNLVGYGCTTCIGNSGPLPENIVEAIQKENIYAVSVLSGNRNFEGRISPHIKANYLASPPLVVAYAIAGHMEVDLYKDSLGKDKDGKDVFLKDIWPSNKEIEETLKDSLNAEMFIQRYSNVSEGPTQWQKIKTDKSSIYNWDEGSTYVKKPPFFDSLPDKPEGFKEIKDARPLLILGDMVTTDHISPAGSIQKDSPTGEYFMEHQILPKDYNSYGSRRGNHEVMMRGTFANIRIRNEMAPGTEGGFTKLYPEEKVLPVYDAVVEYKKRGTDLVVIGGKEYGTGSSRDWAAKGTKLLGIKAVIAESFERIHRSNLIGMGILPLQFIEDVNRKNLKLIGSELISILNIEKGVNPSDEVTVEIKYASGEIKKIKTLCRIDTKNELEYYKNGGILQYVLRNMI